MSTMKIAAFKAYDIRGRVPDELNEEMAYRIGQAYAALLQPKKVAVGYDIRLSSLTLAGALTRGLVKAGVDVVDIGLCGTEQIYFATAHLELDGGIMVTASHNPADYNGMKLVREQSRPISGDSGLREIEALVIAGKEVTGRIAGDVEKMNIMPAYIECLLSFIDAAKIKPFKVVCNAGNGGAGIVMDALEKHLPCDFIKLLFTPDGTFPNGVPNPLLTENRKITAEAVRREKAEIGIAWDGDYDRCFFFDENGEFIEGYYIVGLLASQILKRHSGAGIVHDPRLTWNTIEIVREAGGVPIENKTGHAFMKERMRAEDAVYGGEMSAHHYFKDFAYCDSGMIPWLIVLEIMSNSGKKLSELVSEREKLYPVSGEINRRLANPAKAIERVLTEYGPRGLHIDRTDGIGLEFDRWRFNLRMSNTEPVVRLNVETRGDKELLKKKTEEILNFLGEE
ncbi:MAG: phosphomannomutase [bacterium]|jgi:phosphomannomutase|nr:phosphomannomutase [bacterium]MDD3804924.1 phosphomannomutase [bacterium]